MRPRALLLVFTAAAVVTGAALATVPAYRKADSRRAVEIGLRLSDVGRGWKDTAPKPSPFAIDAGSTLASVSTSQCVGPPAVAKTETDMIVTGASMSLFARLPQSMVSLVMVFRSEGYAARQLSEPVSSLKPCLTSELKKAGAGSAVSVVKVRRFSLATGSPHSLCAEVVLRAGVGPFGELVYFDLVVQQAGRGVVETAYVTPGAPAAKALELRLAHISATRLARYAA